MRRDVHSNVYGREKMRRVAGFLLLITGTLSSAALANDGMKDLYPAFEASAKEASEAGDVSIYALKASGHCQSKFDAAGGTTIDDRAAAATKLRVCLESAQAIGATKMTDGVQGLLMSQAFKVQIEQAKAEEEQRKSEVDFMGLSFGLGFGYSFGGGERVDKAVIVDNVVRSESTREDQPRAIFEFHKYFWCNKGRKIGTRGCGPFVGIAATQEEALSGVAMGLMYGMKVNATDPDGFSIGVGAILDDDLKDLAGGFEDGEAPPTGETTVRFESEARWSAIVFVTRTF